MARGIIRKIVGTGTIGAGVSAAAAAIGNAMGPEASIDPGMHYYEKLAALKDWTPTDVGTAALVGGAVGLGVGLYNRHKEMKREQHEALSDQQFGK
jgi:hypothetical protein